MRTAAMFATACVLMLAASAIAAALIVSMLEAKPTPRIEIRWHQMCLEGDTPGFTKLGMCPRKFWDA